MDKAPPADGLGAVKRFGRDLREGLSYPLGDHLGQAARQQGARHAPQGGEHLKSAVEPGPLGVAGEKGLLVITLYFMVSGMSGNGAGSLYLPFFRNNAAAKKHRALKANRGVALPSLSYTRAAMGVDMAASGQSILEGEGETWKKTNQDRGCGPGISPLSLWAAWCR